MSTQIQVKNNLSSSTPTVSSSSSKKRELSSPEYSIEIKKNKIIAGPITDTETSSLEESISAAGMETDEAVGESCSAYSLGNPAREDSRIYVNNIPTTNLTDYQGLI